MDALDRKVSDLVLVSAFGRGNWLALETASRGWKTTLIDVTDSIENVEPLDLEGPFGLFDTSDLSPTQKERLAEEEELESLDTGFTLWLKEGPIELRSPLTEFLLKKIEVSLEVDRYLRRSSTESHKDQDAERDRRALLKQTFRETWLAQLGHALLSPLHRESFEALEAGEPAALYADFSIRHATREGWAKGLQACAEKGVKVLSGARVRDLEFAGRELKSIEVQLPQDTDGVAVTGRSFVWMLSGAESLAAASAISEGAVRKVFPAGAVLPDWTWRRFRFRLEDLPSDQVPRQAVLIEDLYLPWSHANLLVLRGTREAGVVDLWSKLPFDSGPTEERLGAIGLEGRAILERRFPGARAAPIEIPRTAYSLPVFDPEKISKLAFRKSPNFFLSSPETWDFLDWVGQYRPQTRLLSVLNKMKVQWDLKLAKLAARRAAAGRSP